MRISPQFIILLFLSINACTFPGVHKVAVEQGNRFIPNRIERLEIGMTRDQVQFLLGSPITVNTFDPNRWIYLERIDLNGQIRQNKYLIVNFKDDQVSDIGRASGGAPSDPLSVVDTTPPDHPHEGPWWWPF